MLFSSIYWDPNPEIFRIPFVDWPLLWYGLFFALGFILGFPILVSLLTKFLLHSTKMTPKMGRKKASQIADRLTLYIVIAAVLGARLGHFLFYENPSEYLRYPLEILQIWKGGLASHGAAIGILLATWIYSRKSQVLSWIQILDFLAVPAALIGGFIRIGNFFNQEILGTASNLPWAVTFGHPIDHTLPTPRHPVQLYESFFYFAVFFLLWRLSQSPRFLFKTGKLIGLFLILVFGFRFAVEFCKEEQSLLFPGHFPLTMGQILSLPAIFLGCFFYWRKR